jgi:hypothetical protein
MQPLWMAIEPGDAEVRLLLTEPGGGPAMKARLPHPTAAGRGPALLLEALSAWYGRPLHAVLDADAEAVRERPERWVALAGDLPCAEVSVEWVQSVGARARKRRGRFLEEMGSSRSARRLLGLHTTGLP